MSSHDSLPSIAQVRRHRSGDTGVLRVSGDLDPASAPAVQDLATQLIDEGCRYLVLDLREVEFIDSAGLRLMVVASELAHDACGTLTIRASEPVRRLSCITGLDGTLTII